MKQIYRAFTPKQALTAPARQDPQALNWPGDYREVCEVESRCPDEAFGQLQHGTPGCRLPEDVPSFSVGGVLVDEKGQALLCLDTGWQRL